MKNFFRQIYHNLYGRKFNGLTSPLRVLPDFLVIGVKRCATTSLYHYFAQHPCIFQSAHDKLGYFDDNYNLGINWYKSHFPTIFQKKSVILKHNFFMTYDVTSTYILSGITAKRIFKTLPNVKLITIFRNPVDRAYSDYNLGIKGGIEHRSFEDAINNEIQNIKQQNAQSNNDIEFNLNENPYVGKGLYANILQKWFEIFPNDQIFCTSSEQLSIEPNQTLNEIFDFLHLPNYKIKNLDRKNVEKYSTMDIKTRKLLSDFYQIYNEKLFSLIGKKFNWD